MPADKISIEKAKKNKLFYVVVTGIVYRPSDGRCLILKRHENEKVHPGKYAPPGGKLEFEDFDLSSPTRVNGEVLVYEDAIYSLLAREIKEEAGIEIEKRVHYLSSMVFIRPDGIPVTMLRFAATYKSGEISLEEEAFTDYAWVNEEEVKEYDCIGTIPGEVKEAISHFDK